VGTIDRVGHSGRRAHGPTTGGVRGNRVGAKLSLCAQARGEELGIARRKPKDPIQPLTRDHSASPLRKEPANRLQRVEPGAKASGTRAGSGFHRFAVVLVDRFDCRSRRAARGVVRSRAKSPRKRRGLALPHVAKGERASEAGRGWQSPRSGGGSAFEAVAKAIAERATRRGKALRAVKPALFDEGAAEAVLAATGGLGLAASRQGASEARSSSSRAVENAAVKGHRLRDPRSGMPPGAAGARTLVRRRRERGRARRSWRRYVKKRSHPGRPVGLWLQRTWGRA